ncbi:MAG: efflux RND transporter periplasmic adaptor subunit [Pseudomonadota bacterium]
MKTLTHATAFTVIALMLMGCEEEPLPETAVRVVVTPAIRQDVTIYGDYVGRTEASKRVEVNSRVNGFLEDIAFVEGSQVTERQVLYLIDPAPYQAATDRAEAILSSRQASLAKAIRDEARIKPLFEEDAASQLDYDNALATVQLSRAAVQEAEADLTRARLELDYTEMKAPIAGLIGESRVDVGALIQSSETEPLTMISQIDPIHLYFSMSALDYLNARRRVRGWYEEQKIVREGKALEGQVSITLPDDSIYRYEGTVGFTDPRVNPQTGTFAIRAIVPNPDRELLPGQYTRVKMPLEVRRNALLIPEECILIEQGGVYVMVVLPNNRVERRLIFIGPIIDGKFVVEKGLAPGERLIIHGINKVLHGSLADPITEQTYEAELAAQQEAQLQTERAAEDEDE